MMGGPLTFAAASALVPPTDWSYSARWEMQEIVPGLFVGPYAAAKNDEALAAKAISHILMLRAPEETHLMRPVFPETLSYLIV